MTQSIASKVGLSEAVKAYKATKITVGNTTSNRASMLGEACLRKIVYERTRSKDKKPHDVGLQMIFDAGQVIEDSALDDLRKAGIRIIHQQVSLSIPELQITGHIDAAIETEHGNFPIDIKSMSQHVWTSIKSPEDFFGHRLSHVNKYPAQILLYADMMKADYGVLYCVNKTTFEPRDFWFKTSDFADYIQELKQKAAFVNAHLLGMSLPDRIEDKTHCPRCPFAHVCFPDKDFGPGVTMLSDDALVAKLERWYETKSTSEEHEELDDEIKASVKQVVGTIVTKAADGHSPQTLQAQLGDFLVTVKSQVRKSWEVPEDIKKLHGTVKKTPYQVVNIERREK
jgi:hypothetical protein